MFTLLRSFRPDGSYSDIAACPHFVPATWWSLSVASTSTDLSSGNAPAARVLRRTSGRTLDCTRSGVKSRRLRPAPNWAEMACAEFRRCWTPCRDPSLRIYSFDCELPRIRRMMLDPQSFLDSATLLQEPSKATLIIFGLIRLGLWGAAYRKPLALSVLV